MQDVGNLLSKDSQTAEEYSSNSTEDKNVIYSDEVPTVRTDTPNLYIICEKVLTDSVAVNEVEEALAKFNMSHCRLVVKKKLIPIYYKKLRHCRRTYEDQFVSIFTKILNRHAHGKYKFTEELTALILEKLLGKNINLRHGIGDVKRLLHFLKRALLKHKLRSHATSITLKSRHCLTLFVPGCYCLPGFVENGGQCVMPADCFPDSLRLEYLPRVIII